MTRRLEELQRQRALLQEHLRWLESEIAAETDRSRRPAPSADAGIPPVSPAPAIAAALPPTNIGAAPALPGAIVEPDVQGIHSEVRSGCLLYFGLASAIVGLIVAFIYWRY